MINILEKLLNLIYIRECYFCSSSKDDKLLCKKCKEKIHFLPASVLKRIHGVEVYAVSIYDGIIKDLIRDLKYQNQKQLASVIAELMNEYFLKLQLSAKSDFLVLPVPIHKQRKKERKYNHMDIVAKKFCSLAGLKYCSDFLIRIKDTKKQYNLNRQERIANIKDAFSINIKKNIDKNQPLLIIDDITSTGTTLSEIIKRLQENGYKNLTCFTLSTPDIWN